MEKLLPKRTSEEVETKTEAWFDETNNKCVLIRLKHPHFKV